MSPLMSPPPMAGGAPMADSVSIRPLRAGDRDALLAVLDSDETFRPDEIEVAVELIDAAAAGSDDYRILVATPVRGTPDEPAIVGYICFGSTPMTRSTYDLYWIVCHARARGRGVARALIAAMETELADSGATGIRVETSELEGYGAARRLYAAVDYPEAARLPDFYAPGDGLIIYYKRL
jgi:ribosomal protein S18 acetylase RimI-like enzyme